MPGKYASIKKTMVLALIAMNSLLQPSLAHALKIELTKNINIRTAEAREGKTVLFRQATLPKGSIIEIDDDAFKKASPRGYYRNGKLNDPIEFIQGLKILSAPGFSKDRVAALNAIQDKNGLFIAKKYVEQGHVLGDDGKRKSVSLTSDAEIESTRNPAATTDDDATAATAPGESAEEILKNTLKKFDEVQVEVGKTGKDKKPTECTDCDAKTTIAPADGTRSAYYNKWLKAGVPKKALDQALKAYDRYKGRLDNRRYITINDFTKRANQKRMFLLDMRTGELKKFYVAHGKGSDPAHTGMAKRFSDVNGSLATPAGFLVTGGTYHGENGLSIRLKGLEARNDLSLARAIVIHGASYIGGGKMGRSWGCPAVPKADINEIARKTQGGSLVYNYTG